VAWVGKLTERIPTLSALLAACRPTCSAGEGLQAHEPPGRTILN
jgi:hypothetical protein